MVDDKHRGSQHITASQAAQQARSGVLQSMGPPSQRNSQSIISPKQNGFRKASIAQQYSPSFATHGLGQSQISTQQIQSTSPVQGIETHYTSYLQTSERPHHIHVSSEGQHYSTYNTTSVLPTMPPLYEMVPHYSTRPSSMLGATHNQFSMPSYLPSNNQMAVCMEGTTPHLITTQPDLPNYDSISICRPEISASFAGFASNYEVSEQNEVQSDHKLDDTSEDIHLTPQQCEQAIKPIFDAIVAGRINEASNKLLTASQWLSSSVVQLGFHLDNEAEYSNRLSMWRSFNHCWEALAQKQINLLQQELRTKRKAAGKLPRTKIQRMVDELITICDQIEEFGLVDYEMGIWEEQIVNAFITCLDLQNKCDASLSDSMDSDKRTSRRVSSPV